MKNNKKKIIIITSVIASIVILFCLIFLGLKFRDSNSLTLQENKWIELNKTKVIDIAILNDTPILSYEGEGIVYNYLNYVIDNHSLQFNVIPYKLDNNVEYDYKMDIVSAVSSNEIVLLEDNLVLITKDNIVYTDLKEINNLKLGIHSIDKSILNTYFKDNNLEFVEYTSYTELKQAISSLNQEIDINGIVIPKTIFTKELIENNYKISYHLNDLKKYYVLKTNGSTELNSILNKSFNKWKEKNYEIDYNYSLLENYFDFKNISETEQIRLQSKVYTYGFIDYGIYNYIRKDEISGLTSLVLKDFNSFSGLSITYTKYNSISRLLEDFSSKKIDFMLDIGHSNGYKNQIYNTVGVFDKQLVIISDVSNTENITSMYSLKGKQVLTIKDSYLEQYLINNNIKVQSYNNFNDLSKDFSSNDIALVDLENYNFYKSTAFKNSKTNYILDNNEKYSYILNDTSSNRVFKNLFDFYLNYNCTNELINKGYVDIAYKNNNVIYILVLILIVFSIYVIVDFSNHIKYMVKTIKKNKKINLTKEEKIKYIDQLTSLKNRAYFNSRIESWDESEVYPQSIIIIDLNNVSYINDNYGREEGDKVITEAANILIQNQLQNSEIIRTDGNEFLVYLVGYNEKQIISYLRKLNKELKGLSHGFGAASGYSIINDAIKTIDDAVNEATLDMKNNKEDIEY